MEDWRQYVVFALSLAYLVLMIVLVTLGKVGVALFSPLAGLALALLAVSSIDFKRISVLGKVFEIEKNVEIAEEARKQIETQAEEIRVIRDQVEATKSDVAGQARSIGETYARIQQSERELAQTKLSVQALAAKVVQTQLILFVAGYALSCVTLTLSRGPTDTAEARIERANKVWGLVLPRIESLGKMVESPYEITPDSIKPEPFDFEALFRKAGIEPKPLGDAWG